MVSPGPIVKELFVKSAPYMLHYSLKVVSLDKALNGIASTFEWLDW